MELFRTLQTSEPRITKGSREVLYCWPGTLAVIVHKDQTLGPFATTGPWSQTDVTHAMTDYLRSVAPKARKAHPIFSQIRPMQEATRCG